MRRRRQRIPVEDRSNLPVPLERLQLASQRLLVLDPARLDRLVAIADAWLSVHDQRLESRAEFDLRIRAIEGKRGPAN